MRRSGVQPCVTLAARAVSYSVSGEACLSEAGQQSLFVHLHRFLSPVLRSHSVERLWLLLGFEGSAMKADAIELRLDGAFATDIGVSFAELAKAYREGGDWSSSAPKMGRSWTALPICGVAEQGVAPINAFVVSDAQPGLQADGALEGELQRRVNEAVRAFRCNSVRMLFEDAEQMGVKEFVYTLLERLPDLCGVDHSAALILTGSLEAMVMQRSRPGDFEIVAERLFIEPESGQPPYERLVGLELGGEGEEGGLLGYAFEQLRTTGLPGMHVFVADSAERLWLFLGDEERSAPFFATRIARPTQEMTILLPLLANNEAGIQELLGFLSLNFRQPCPLAAGVSVLLEGLAARLARALRRSSLFSLSAHQLYLFERLREASLAVQSVPEQARLASFIGDVNRRIAESTRIPCIAVGYVVREAAAEPLLRFVRPHGFTHFGDIDLPLSKVSDVHQTSVACLAVRLGRALALSGGRHRDGQTVFKNHLWVNEEAGLVVDSRRRDPQTASARGAWRPLSEYYKPSRDQSYATLAFPILFDGEVLGVIAVEVDRDTQWLWWTGFGSSLFYRLLANELATTLRSLGASC
jgi:hypothetical protein